VTYARKVVNDPRKITIELKAEISEISNTGTVTVSFNRDIQVPLGYINFTEDVFKITVI
jgi:hypothetical protein